MPINDILVLGSKPRTNLPKIKFHKIYAANAAAERVFVYKKNNQNLEFISVVGALAYNRDLDVKNRIKKSKPDKIYVRSGKIKKNELPLKTKLFFLSNKKQWDYQKKFFKRGVLSLIFSELKYKTTFLNKIKYLLKNLKNKSFQGASTGFFTILLALEENVNSRIIVSGISMQGGLHFYKSARDKKFNYDGRAAVDRYLISKLDKNLKNRIYSTDEDFIKFAKVKRFMRPKVKIDKY